MIRSSVCESFIPFYKRENNDIPALRSELSVGHSLWTE